MLGQRFVKWLHLRFRYTGTRTLKQNQVLVFMYQQGFLYLVLILITFIAGINYANNLILGFCFLISAILCISFYLSFKQLHAITLDVVVDEVGKVNEAFKVRINLQQDHATPKFLNFKIDEQLQSFLFEEKQQSFELNFIPQQRGEFSVPPIQIYSTYPLGLVRAWTYIYLTNSYWIAPEAKSLTHQSQNYSNTGEPDLDEFKELRTFKSGDSLQSISWKQAARGQGLFVKQFDDLVDTHAMQIEYSKMPSADHEEKLSFMMELVDRCHQAETPYSIILPHAQTENGIGEQHYIHIKTLLAQA
ncbi:DUF58 domain-containing protein [Acinetobacter guillouiae]|uniref:DUF58 domain-containing protein n=1 Tax=Acinetobacter guillouiae TaxID=106649 RepID=UPI0026E27F2B|nr:DUF58 domain-containing protein [Acinetobacter guillouiae]MDO6644319.1 DUF58 domain-containing protein [Acinetobacter guillouiae]